MKEQKWNKDWLFWVNKDSFALGWDIPDNARNITLPHDAMIEKPANPESLNGGNTGFRDGDIYTYVKKLYVGEEQASVFLLKFEGVYMNAFVYVNGQFAAKSPFGYTTFYVNLSDLLKYGQENEICVQVRTGAMSNSRWYSGAGIYRDVYLLKSGLTYIEPEGVQIKTENADDQCAVLMVTTELENKASMQKLILETVIKDNGNNVVAKESTYFSLFRQEKRKIKQRISVNCPKLWSAETPNLYRYEVKLYQNTEERSLLDENADTFGIRTISVDSKRGLRVNGTTVNLRGGCIHHDSGLLGTATYEDAQYRQIEKMKQAGFNAIRMSHHPMAPAMLRVCDVIGMYVMDEACDMWNQFKGDYDYALYFQEWWEKDVTAMVRKDYNHPSVIMYSIGNEIPEIGMDKGSQTGQILSDKIKSMDDTRYVLAAINGVFAAGDRINEIVKDVKSELDIDENVKGNINEFMTFLDSNIDKILVHPIIGERLETACAALDVAGYNYMTVRYQQDGEKYPNRVIVGSETYPTQIARNWELVKKLPHVIGDFTWTGWDYIGEAGVGITAYRQEEAGFGAKFPAQLAYCGDFDITGIRRPASYYREIVYGMRKDPYITAQDPFHYGEFLFKTPWVISNSVPNWNWSGAEGKPIIVEVYGQGDEVELLLNGQSLGRKQAGKAVGFRTLFELSYEPGTLTAVSYENGREIGRSELITADSRRALVVEKEEYVSLKRSEQELIYIQPQSVKLIFAESP